MKLSPENTSEKIPEQSEETITDAPEVTRVRYLGTLADVLGPEEAREFWDQRKARIEFLRRRSLSLHTEITPRNRRARALIKLTRPYH